MSCKEYPDLIETGLDDQHSAQARAHLLVCSSCSDYYKILQREKEVYGLYLSGIEPPADLWIKFQEKLNAETPAIEQASEKVGFNRQTGFFGFFRLSPVLGLAAAIIVLGVIWLGFTPDENKNIAQIESFNAPNVFEDQKNVSDLKTKTEKNKTVDFSPAKKVGGRQKSLSSKQSERAVRNTTGIKAMSTRAKTISGSHKKETIAESNLTEIQKQLMLLEKESMRQIEKTELLLRSFRNARAAGEDRVYDVEYEKRQARKLLEKNVELRQIAQNCGDFYTEEILDKAEAVLLDIANLENNPSQEKVQSIQERLKNQNLIASLQVY